MQMCKVFRCFFLLKESNFLSFSLVKEKFLEDKLLGQTLGLSYKNEPCGRSMAVHFSPKVFTAKSSEDLLRFLGTPYGRSSDDALLSRSLVSLPWGDRETLKKTK
jgi:hypothetical protein